MGSLQSLNPEFLPSLSEQAAIRADTMWKEFYVQDDSGRNLTISRLNSTLESTLMESRRRQVALIEGLTVQIPVLCFPDQFKSLLLLSFSAFVNNGEQ